MGSNNTNAPIASQHVFLHQLADERPHNKVRFLGCVDRYDANSASLRLFHQYPARARNVPICTVDASLVLETANRICFEEGRWVNVIGYVRGMSEDARGVLQAHVQAVILWDAGAIRVDQYEKVMEGVFKQQKEKEKRRT